MKAFLRNASSSIEVVFQWVLRGEEGAIVLTYSTGIRPAGTRFDNPYCELRLHWIHGDLSASLISDRQPRRPNGMACVCGLEECAIYSYRDGPFVRRVHENKALFGAMRSLYKHVEITGGTLQWVAPPGTPPTAGEGGE